MPAAAFFDLFRTISGNAQQIYCIYFQKKADQICVEKQEHLVL